MVGLGKPIKTRALVRRHSGRQGASEVLAKSGKDAQTVAHPTGNGGDPAASPGRPTGGD